MSQQGMDAIVSGIEASGANGANGGWFQLKAELDLDLVFGVATRGMQDSRTTQFSPFFMTLRSILEGATHKLCRVPISIRPAGREIMPDVTSQVASLIGGR